jgi:hypothetical protein
VFEFSATLRTEKSLPTKATTRQIHAVATNRAWPAARGRASAIQAVIARCAPTIGKPASSSDSSNARISARCPTSGIIGTS